MAGAWANWGDVLTDTGRDVSNTDLSMAQTMIEALINRVYRATDATTSSYYWLNKAVTWQAVYVSEHPELVNMGNMASMSQDGFSVSFSGGSEGSTNYYHPVALSCLNNLYRGSNTTLRMNSAFQKSRASRVGWRSI